MTDRRRIAAIRALVVEVPIAEEDVLWLCDEVERRQQLRDAAAAEAARIRSQFFDACERVTQLEAEVLKLRSTWTPPADMPVPEQEQP